MAKAATKATQVLGGLVLVAVLALGLSSCAAWNTQTVHNVENSVLSAEQIGCILAADLAGAQEPQEIATLCQITQPLTQDVINAINTIRDGGHKAKDPVLVAKLRLRLAIMAHDAREADAGDAGGQ